MTNRRLAQIKGRIGDDCHIIFANLPGVCADEFSLDKVAELTGMKVVYDTKTPPPHNLFNILSGADEKVYADENGVRIARKGNLWLMLHPQVDHTLLRDIIIRCGVTPIINGQGVVHGNSKLLGVFSAQTSGINSTLRLPQKTDWYEWFTQTEYKNTDCIPISIDPKQARLFIAKSLL